MRALLLLAVASVAAAAFSWPTIGNPSTMSCCANMDGSISSLFTTYGLQLRKKRDDASAADESSGGDVGAPVDVKAGRCVGVLLHQSVCAVSYLLRQQSACSRRRTVTSL